jgi:hypothetical protein
MNRAASALGKKAKGVPKKLTPKERQRRKASLAVAREKRWPRIPTGGGGGSETSHRHSES